MNLVTSNTITMSSMEIAELTGKEHRNVMRDIRLMLVDLYGEGGLLSFEHTYRNSQNGQDYPAFLLPRREVEILLTGYSVKLRAKCLDRLHELESKVAEPRELTRIELLHMMLESETARLEAEAQRDHAVLTKAEIGNRREATAMNTASQAVKKANTLEQQLDRSKEYCTVKRMTMIHHGQPFDWRSLKAASAEMGVPAIDVFDQNYGTVKAYHASVWLEVYGLELE